MNFRSRALAYVGAGAAGLFATGAFAAPALAAGEADVSVKAASSKISVGAVAKAFRIDLKNAGPGVATATTLTIDLSGLEPNQIGFDLEQFEGEEDVKVAKATEGEIVLELGDGAPGETLPFFLPLFLAEGAEAGPAGTLKVAITSAAPDPDTSNNAVSVPIEVTKSGVDLTALALDVYALAQDEPKPVPPGETAPLFWALFNQGDVAARGVRLGVTLPKHVSFVDDYDGCTVSSDRRVLSCEAPDAVLPPGEAISTEEGLLVKVAEDAPGPATLTGGSVKGSAIGTTDLSTAARAATANELPEGFTIAKVDELPGDIDPGDNDADFSVFVGEAGGTGGGGGDLPVTGVQAGLIGGVGLAVLAGGGALLLMSRRRKVVLVAPGDETPTV